MYDNDLCTICAALDPGETDEGVYYQVRLGTWLEVQQRSSDGCKACQFFVDLLVQYVSDRDGSDIAAYFTEQNENTNRRYRDHTDFDKDKFEDEVWISGMRLLFKPAQMVSVGGSSYTCDELVLEACTARSEDVGETGRQLDHRRDIPANPDDKRCYEQIKLWMDQCESHGCQPPGDGPLPRRLIEVSPDPGMGCRLIESSGQLGKFLALSQCRSEVPSLKLTSGTYDQFKHLLPTDKLSQNHQDAIKVTRNLGFKYLWIEELCVIQDDEVEKARELVSLSQRYLSCAILLAADASKDGNAGLLQDRVVQYSPPLGPNRDLCLRPACLRWLDAVTYSPLAKSAFAVQERLLAPRVLHFTRRQLMWECADGWRLEAAHEIDKRMGSGQPRYSKALVQPLLYPSTGPAVSQQDDTVGRFDAWFKAVQEFAAADTIRADNKLEAVAGLASALNNGSLGEYVAGVWLKGLAFSLPWSRQYHLLKKSESYRGPSWSWASVDRQVSYDPNRKLSLINSPWMQKLGPKVIDVNIERTTSAPAYTGFLPGCSITLEASCLPVTKLLGLTKTFHPTLALDTSNAFDCHCCRAESEVVDTTGAPANSYERYICMIAYGDGFKDDQSSIDTIILHPVKDQKDTYERVGVMRIAFDWPDNDGRFAAESTSKSVDEEFEELGWSRTTLKLI